MRTYLWPWLFVLAIAVTLPPSVMADSYRCGRKLIRTGDSSVQVLRVCGQPEARDRGQAKVRVNGIAKSVSVQRWHYRQGARSLPRIVNIHRGRVVSIEVGNR